MLIPILKIMVKSCSFSVHSVQFFLADLVNLKNLLVRMNPHPGLSSTDNSSQYAARRCNSISIETADGRYTHTGQAFTPAK